MRIGAGDRSPHFDPDAYHDSVVRPLRGRPHAVPADLRVRYAVDDEVIHDAARLACHITEVVAEWTERAGLPDYSAAVYAALLQAHAELATDPRTDLTDAAWWRRYHPPAEAEADPDTAAPSTPSTDHPTPGPPSGDLSWAGRPSPADPPAEPTEPQPAPDRAAVLDRVRDLRAERRADQVRLTWIWPRWATQALVCWEDGRSRRTIDLEAYRQNGAWRTVLNADLAAGSVEFTVAVRGPAAERREWSPAVAVTCAGPALTVDYEVRRLRRYIRSRVFVVGLSTDRPPLQCEVVLGFATTDHMPGSLEECEEISRAFLAYERTEIRAEVPRHRGPGWLRCFAVDGDAVVLKDPHHSTMRI